MSPFVDHGYRSSGSQALQHCRSAPCNVGEGIDLAMTTLRRGPQHDPTDDRYGSTVAFFVRQAAVRHLSKKGNGLGR